ncbi:fumarylacetoacetate hydrolase family protein [Rhodoferax sp.]|uniref:fumarylacetoacetate hydrolase family protein n=2 Tax=Rhodoferax sp. TaxID=50421 RepID=UPI00271B8955|nr:fumarylacetoacetate hydrolase family protein [Rhodoferax sp.]MDO9143802.1 fumarylacetoacetate hydrolase family protein [Rhodoferax sp.]MDP1531048.1 fumarylacetoacetate hydrolase family protein [Rhodoferax sp.]MDP1945065.1 fumarylacetoacetate hydrolase family protein [Rhodoferax sp.]MDP2442331.1 fumarylacetoacetate hydrolase family protein [Rhodoferax sp.]MDP3193061.1 fumarylacetoacetate hydrolase family protein [Rhodoferax sp.]
MLNHLSSAICLPLDAASATLVGRVWLNDVGPVLVCIKPDGVYDLSSAAVTMSDLLELDDPAAAVRQHAGTRLGDTEAILKNSSQDERNPALPWFLAPCDLQAIKASGVTFISSMLERVIEEQARGDASRADSVRQAVVAVIGDNLSSIKPGSSESAKLKEALLAQGAWSQYLEVGIGPDAEIFTKAQPMSAVGVGAEVGIHPGSHWNNPEPEIVLAVNSRGQVQGAALGNDVNLRDFEGRSALLLGKAKDNNASCAIGPFIRLFDAHFSLDSVRACDLAMQVTAANGFCMQGSSSMSKISRDPLELVEHAFGPNHQYPDGFMLFLGTMFAPTQDRHGPGQGFTHELGDVVTVSTATLGCLVNRVNASDKVAPWTYGIRALMQDLNRRRVLKA